MDLLGTTATWMAALMSAWTVVTGLAGARRDGRLAASGARGLHAAAALLLLGMVLHFIEERRGVEAAPAGIAALLAARTLWTDVVARLLGWALLAGVVAAVVPSIARRSGRDAQVGAQVTAGIVALLFAGAAAVSTWVITPTAADDVGTGPVAVQVWPGIVARLLYGAGLAALVVPAALYRVPSARSTRLRWTLAALALMVAALALAAWVRYAVVAPPAELDPNGVPFARRWTVLSALWALAPLLVAGHATALASRAGEAASRRRQWAPWLFVLLAAAIVVAVLAPALHRWTRATDVAIGFVVHPPLVVLAVLPAVLLAAVLLVRELRGGVVTARAALVAGGAAAAMLLVGVLTGARGAGTLATIAAAGGAAALAALVALRRARTARAMGMAAAVALLLAGTAVAAISSRPATLEVEQGTAREVTVRGHPWRLTSQGASQLEEPLFDAALVAFEVERPAGSAIVTAGERIYRDAHGHAGTRVAVPGIMRGFGGDLRLVVLGLRGEGALVQVQHHPLAGMAWLLALLLVAALVTAAAFSHREEA